MPFWLRLFTILIPAIYLLPLFVALALDLARLIQQMYNQRLRSSFTRFLDDHLFRSTCLVLMLLCFYLLWQQIASGKPSLGAITALIVPILILALGCQYGQIFFSRLRKLGPLEFFELKAPELLSILGETFEELNFELDMQLHGEPLSPEKQRVVRRADLYLANLEFQTTDTLSTPQQAAFVGGNL